MGNFIINLNLIKKKTTNEKSHNEFFLGGIQNLLVGYNIINFKINQYLNFHLKWISK